MKYWLQSLSENGFDVFTIVYIAVLLIVYHYLTRWYLNIQVNRIIDELELIRDYIDRIK